MAAWNKADLKLCANYKDGHLEESLMNFSFHVNILTANTEEKRRHLSCKFPPSWNGSKCHTWKWTSKHPEIHRFTCLSSKSFDWNARCTLILYIYFPSNTLVWNAYRLYLSTPVHCQGQHFSNTYSSALSFQLNVFGTLIIIPNTLLKNSMHKIEH